MWGVRKDIYKLYCQHDRLNRVCPACNKLIRNTILENTQVCQWQTLPKLYDRGKVELGEAGRGGLLEAAEGKDNRSSDNEQHDVAKAMKKLPASVGSGDQIGPEATETLGECARGWR